MFKFAVIFLILGLSAAYKHYHSISLPVKSQHHLKVIHMPSHEQQHTTYVNIPGGVLPVYLTFKTQSSPVYVKQEHMGSKGSYQKSDSKDEPHKLVHEVVKPVIQELKEVITPYRKVVQVIEPVKEERLTNVHKGEKKSYGGYGDEGGSGGSGGYGGSSSGYETSSGSDGYGGSSDMYDSNGGSDGYSASQQTQTYKMNDYKGMKLSNHISNERQLTY